MFKNKTVYNFFKRILFKYRYDFQYFFEEVTGTDKQDYILNHNLSFFKVIRLTYYTFKFLLIKNVYHTLGYKYFLSTKLKVNKHVLIPRFETELLILKLENYLKKLPKLNNIVDLGTGSGAIAINLKKLLPDYDITAIDISKRALKIATTNAEVINTDIHFELADMANYNLDKYDVVVSNPPYISKKYTIDTNVYNTEPHSALFAEEEGLFYYKQIINNCSYNNKLIAFEIGETQAGAIANLIKNKFPSANISIEKDLNDCDRYIFAKIKR